MTVPIPDLPAEGSSLAQGTPWYGHYTAIDQAVKELQQLYLGLAPPAGFVTTINGLSPDASGDIEVTAADLGAMSSSYTPSFNDIPLGYDITVIKDEVTGFWPADWNADGSPIYTGGSTSSGKRPHSRQSTVVWLGVDPAPATVDSGDGGMLRGFDQRAIPGP